MAIIAFLTDFGDKDEYVGLVKGVVLSINPRVKIVDLSHQIPPQDVIWASYLLGNAYKFFPKNTIFLSVIDPGLGTEGRIIIVKTKGYIFVCPDNGILTKVLAQENPRQIIEVKNKKFFLKEISSTFRGRDIMAPVVGYISKGVPLESFGPEIKEIKHIKLPNPIRFKNRMIGEVIHIDHFGNLVTNIEKGLGTFWQKIGKKGKIPFYIEIKGRKIFRINQAYAEAEKGELLAIWGSRNLLEISINLGSAEEELKVEKGEKVMLKFFY